MAIPEYRSTYTGNYSVLNHVFWSVSGITEIWNDAMGDVRNLMIPGPVVAIGCGGSL